MCGIAGFFSKEHPISGNDFYLAHSKMANRGPDDEGFSIFVANNIINAYGDRSIDNVKSKAIQIQKIPTLTAALSHVRLSIIDLTEGGHQPFTEQSLSMVFSGEIYNYKELKEELQKIGHTFRTLSDSEVLFHAYQEWGTDCFNKCNGMWAVAFYHIKEDKLILSRDRFGVKPLFYRCNNDILTFASEIKVIASFQQKNYINKTCATRYLTQSILCDEQETLFENIYEVPPGCIITFNSGKKTSTRRYWQYKPELKNYKEEEAVELFDYLFRDSIHLRMRSDVEVGSLLSGGLDSNVIVGTLYKEGLISNNYRTYSSVYNDKRFSEQKYIEKTIQKFDICSDLLCITPELVMDTIDSAIYHLEMPTRAIPMMLQYLLYQRIAKTSSVKVVLNGQGADELFGGYNSDYITRFLQLFYDKRYVQMIREIKNYKSNRHVSLKQILSGIFHQSKVKPIHKKNAFNEIAFNQITKTPLREYLMYDDRAAMAFGIENRAPFLDYRLVEFAYTLSSDLKVNLTFNKAVVRNYALKNKLIDETIINRKDKMGFVSPQEIWQKVEWKGIFDETFLDIKNNGLAGFDGQKYYAMYRSYSRGENENWPAIWRCFCFYRWVKIIKNWNIYN